MRPIDADALMRIHKLETSTIGKDWTVGDLATAIELAPTIDAIPVEWIRNVKEHLPDSIEKMGLDAVLILWAQEQEAQK